MKFLIIGAGMQGRACAFDLLKNPATTSVLMADASKDNLAFAKKFLKSTKVETVVADAGEPSQIAKLAAGRDVIVSAVPYFFNLALAKVAIASGCHWVDLGGNTDIVLEELKLHAQAVKAGVTLLPDVGLGPGMTTTLAVHGMEQLDAVTEVYIRDGGLPQKPRPPMNYLLTFSEYGLINEYVSEATALRNGKVVKVPGLSELETVELPGFGAFEAGHAAGGLSTLAMTYAGKVKTMDCKLLRYPGHCAVINSLNALGFFSEEKVKVGDEEVAPRELSARLFRAHFDRPGEKDMVLVKVTVRGTKGGRPAEVVHEMVDYYDDKNKMTSMMRTTGFPAAIVAQMLADKTIDKPGAYPVETGIPTGPFLAEAKKRGFALSWKLTYLDKPSSVGALALEAA